MSGQGKKHRNKGKPAGPEGTWVATSVLSGRRARVSRYFLARMNSQASMAAEVSLPVCETFEPWRGCHQRPPNGSDQLMGRTATDPAGCR